SIALRNDEPRQLWPIDQLQSFNDGRTYHRGALSELRLLLPHDEPPQRQPFLTNEGHGFDLGVDADCPISANVVRNCLSLSLDNSVVSRGQDQPIQICKTLKDGPYRAASFLRDLGRFRHRWRTTKQLYEDLDQRQPRALAALPTFLNLGRA